MPVIQVYGSTETCPVAVYSRIGGDLSRKTSTGLPGLLCEARIVDDAGHDVPPGVAGEVLVRGPNVFVEYWGNEAATAEALRDGWYHTGDIGTRRCRRLFLYSRPQEEHDHLRRREHLSGGGRARAARLSRRRRRRGHRPSRSEMAGGAGRLCGAARRQPLRGERHHRACLRPARALQGAARDRVRRGRCRATRSARFSISCSKNRPRDEDRGARRRQRIVRRGRRLCAGRARGAAVAARCARRLPRTSAAGGAIIGQGFRRPA